MIIFVLCILGFLTSNDYLHTKNSFNPGFLPGCRNSLQTIYLTTGLSIQTDRKRFLIFSV
jgi:hypothetical protein